MGRTTEELVEQHLREHEALSHASALLMLSTTHGADSAQAIRIIEKNAPSPTPLDAAMLVKLFDELIVRSGLDRVNILQWLNRVNAHACDEVLQCIMPPVEIVPGTLSPQSFGSANATGHADHSPNTNG